MRRVVFLLALVSALVSVAAEKAPSLPDISIPDSCLTEFKSALNQCEASCSKKYPGGAAGEYPAEYAACFSPCQTTAAKRLESCATEKK